ncbi:MAG TPA: hypothetical protein VET47_00050 [Candidatus Limnocylindrales bacterium]|nr:hypothetical protein [Candidatus Limnocylindrales bacterium]
MIESKILTSQISKISDGPQDSAQMLDIRNGLTNHFFNIDDYPANFREIGDGWYKVVNDKATEFLIKLFSDGIINDILTSLMGAPLTIPQILQICESPQTSTYRKFSLLMECGIVRPKGYLGKGGGQRVRSYYSIISGIRIGFDRKSSLSIKLN